jgi:hypothetical protein
MYCSITHRFETYVFKDKRNLTVKGEIIRGNKELYSKDNFIIFIIENYIYKIISSPTFFGRGIYVCMNVM